MVVMVDGFEVILKVISSAGEGVSPVRLENLSTELKIAHIGALQYEGMNEQGRSVDLVYPPMVADNVERVFTDRQTNLFAMRLLVRYPGQQRRLRHCPEQRLLVRCPGQLFRLARDSETPGTNKLAVAVLALTAITIALFHRAQTN